MDKHGRPRLTQKDLRRFVAGKFPHEHKMDDYNELRNKVEALGLAHLYDLAYNAAITDVLDLLDEARQ